MDEEDQIGREFSRVVRAAMMGMGQLRETMARRAAENARAAREATQEAQRIAQLNAAAQQQHQRETTAYVRQQVGSQQFWSAPDANRIADATSYTAALYHKDQNAAAGYDKLRDETYKRFGINLDEVRAAHPGSEDARHAALVNALDDHLAKIREDQAAEQDRAEEADLRNDAEQHRVDADQEREQPAPDVDTASAHEEEAAHDESRADVVGDRAHAHEADADRYAQDERDHQRQAASPAGTARSSAAAATKERTVDSYPHEARESLQASIGKRGSLPRARSARRGAARDRGLSR